MRRVGPCLEPNGLRVLSKPWYRPVLPNSWSPIATIGQEARFARFAPSAPDCWFHYSYFFCCFKVLLDWFCLDPSPDKGTLDGPLEPRRVEAS
jgi:hypothetical protein